MGSRLIWTNEWRPDSIIYKDYFLQIAKNNLVDHLIPKLSGQYLLSDKNHYENYRYNSKFRKYNGEMCQLLNDKEYKELEEYMQQFEL